MDRNSITRRSVVKCPWSLSARRAWIEIFAIFLHFHAKTVALRKESVDRNCYVLAGFSHGGASLSARRAWIEITGWQNSLRDPYVALRKESVDRNLIGRALARLYSSSLSARRAWIEIPRQCPLQSAIQSLSARRAWIEIFSNPGSTTLTFPSLSARRAWIEIALTCGLFRHSTRRSPQGERG